MPWKYTRSVLARHWGCKPSAVDEESVGEINLALQILGLEAEADAYHQNKKAPGR
ncbi:MAG TPA: hypothetical protein VGW38_17775 [Chloroflexota bacterium]|nr:hypothetical protein [Chloroflexota bacterium]